MVPFIWRNFSTKLHFLWRNCFAKLSLIQWNCSSNSNLFLGRKCSAQLCFISRNCSTKLRFIWRNCSAKLRFIWRNCPAKYLFSFWNFQTKMQVIRCRVTKSVFYRPFHFPSLKSWTVSINPFDTQLTGLSPQCKIRSSEGANGKFQTSHGIDHIGHFRYLLQVNRNIIYTRLGCFYVTAILS